VFDVDGIRENESERKKERKKERKLYSPGTTGLYITYTCGITGLCDKFAAILKIR
jgi:hypothetical protein